MVDGENPFVLLTIIKVKEGMINDYLAIAKEADKAFEAREDGMLFHNFDGLKKAESCSTFVLISARLQDRRSSYPTALFSCFLS